MTGISCSLETSPEIETASSYLPQGSAPDGVPALREEVNTCPPSLTQKLSPTDKFANKKIFSHCTARDFQHKTNSIASLEALCVYMIASVFCVLMRFLGG